MVQKISGRLIFTYGEPKTKYQKSVKKTIKLSLLSALVGIFLLPNFAFLSSITPENIIELTNRQRREAGLNPLTSSQFLAQAAILKGKAILESNIFKHTINDKKFSTWIKESGYNYSYAGENLAIDFISSEAVIDAWKKSPLHKKNLLNPYYQELGVASIAGKFQGQDTIVVVQIFGAPATAYAAQPLANAQLTYSGSSQLPPEANVLSYQAYGAENLLTHSVLKQNLLPLNNKKIILPEISLLPSPNKLFIQLNPLFSASDFVIIFSLLSFIYCLIFLHYYYFSKIRKLLSA